MDGMRRWVFPVEPEGLVEMLRAHSMEKQGPFAWPARDEHSRPTLFMDLAKKSGGGGFYCTVRAIRYITPTSPFARGSVHILTLRISKARPGYATVIMTCRKTDEYGEACQHFASEMDRLLAELTASVLNPGQDPSGFVMAGTPTRQPLATPAAEVEGQSETAEPADDWDAPRVGHPGLDHDEVICRLAKAQQAEEIRRADKSMTWKEIAREIGWNKGADKAGVALLADARRRLHRLAADDPLLAEVAAWRRAKETKET
jgi:hypothetical protein